MTSSLLIELLFVMLCGITLVAFIVAINARGPVKTALSFVFATALLIGTTYELVSYFGKSKLAAQMQQAKALEEERLRNEQQAQEATAEEYAQMLTAVSKEGREAAYALRGLDPRDESVEMEVFFSKAAWVRNRSKALLRDFSSKRPPSEGFTQSRETLKRGLDQLERSGRYLDLFFKSETEAEEENRENVYQASLREAVSAFGQVDALAAQKR